MGRLDDISRALIARLDERQDAEVASLNEAYAAALNHTITRAGELIPRGPDGRLVPDPKAIVRLRDAFERFGDQGAGLLLEEHVGRVALSLERVGDTIDAGFAQLGEDPLSTDELALSTLARTAWVDRLGELGRYHRAQIRDAVMRQALGRSDASSMRREMRELSGRSRRQADRLHHDALIGYSRSVQTERAERLGFEFFEYFGPVDTVTRDFCRSRAGRVYTRDEIDRMDNGHMPNVMQTGGGHRCRHHWRPVRRDWFSDEEWAELRDEQLPVGVDERPEPAYGTGSSADDIYDVWTASASMVNQESDWSCGAAIARQVLLDDGVDVPESTLYAYAIGIHKDAGDARLMTAGNIKQALIDHGGYSRAKITGGSIGTNVPGPALRAWSKTKKHLVAAQGGHWVIVDEIVGDVVKLRDPWGAQGPGSGQGVEAEVSLDKFMIAFRNGGATVVAVDP